MPTYGVELRERVLRAWDAGELQEDVAARFEVSVRWIQKIAKLRREEGDFAPKPASGGRPRIVDGEIEARLKAQVAKTPDATLAELQETCAIPGCLMNVFRALERLKITRKKVPHRRRTASSGHRRRTGRVDEKREGARCFETVVSG
jgi:transposase